MRNSMIKISPSMWNCILNYYAFSPLLTWRDVQHLIVQTSKRYSIDDGLSDDQPHGSWQKNGAGFYGKSHYNLSILWLCQMSAWIKMIKHGRALFLTMGFTPYTVSHVLGFGLMDAEAMVTQAKTWKLVAPQRKCTTKTNYVWRYCNVWENLMYILQFYHCMH
jgi:hypothetical protein